MTVIASGLDNPRDLAFGPGGRLFLAEAGHGGSRCIPGGEEGDLCVGFTSKIDVVKIAKHRGADRDRWARFDGWQGWVGRDRR
jgi:hypothetical protein